MTISFNSSRIFKGIALGSLVVAVSGCTHYHIKLGPDGCGDNYTVTHSETRKENRSGREIWFNGVGRFKHASDADEASMVGTLESHYHPGLATSSRTKLSKPSCTDGQPDVNQNITQTTAGGLGTGLAPKIAGGVIAATIVGTALNSGGSGSTNGTN